MTKEDYLEKMKRCANNDEDYEEAHYDADRILCEIIENELGWGNIIKVYNSVGKWYS